MPSTEMKLNAEIVNLIWRLVRCSAVVEQITAQRDEALAKVVELRGELGRRNAAIGLAIDP